MTIPEILEELRPYTGKFPRKAMCAAIEQRETITPELLREFEQIAARAEEYARKDNFMLQTFAVYLLAQFGETRAFQPLVKMISLPGELPFDLFGDTITEDLARLLGTLYDGDRKALERLIETEEVNEYVRSAALDSFIVLERSGKIERPELIDYYRKLFQGRLQRQPSHAWNGLVSSCADLPAPELLGEIRQAFADGLVEDSFADLQWIEREIATPLLPGNDPDKGGFSTITDAIAELEWWAAFKREANALTTSPARPPKRAALPRLQYRDSSNPSDPGVMRLEPKIGRNDPCPCGSGKKYKKCCLSKGGVAA